MKRNWLAAAAIALAAVPVPAQTPRVDADPAMWVVKDADTTIYLFGTVHLLDEKTDWFNEGVKTAYDAAGEVVLEVVPADDATAKAMFMDRAVDKSGRPLGTRLGPEHKALYDAEMEKLGAPPGAFDALEPWAAALTMAVLGYQRAGLDPERGVERVLRAAAQKDAKTLGQLETTEWQIGLFDSLDEELQLVLLRETLETMAELEKSADEMMNTWRSGDIDGLAALMNEALQGQPELAKLLLADRNARWAEWIDSRLDRPGTVFLAVGAGHLGGPDSVQSFLGKRGIAAERAKT